MNQAQINELAAGAIVLVVDDEEFNRVLLRDSLEAQGYTVREAENGLRAMQSVAEQMPDVILLDIMMPNLDGFQVCHRLKEAPNTSQIPILMITALSERQDRLRGIQAGANDFITKPIDLPDTLLRVRNAVHTKRLFDQVQASYERLQTLETLRQKLVQIIIRDLHDPLEDVLARLKGVLSTVQFAEEHKKPITEAEQLVSNLVRKLNSLLELSRLEPAKEKTTATEESRQAA